MKNNIALIALVCFVGMPLAVNRAAGHAHAKILTEESASLPAEKTMPVIKNLTDSLDFLNIIKERELPLESIALQTALNRILDLWNAQNEGMLNDLNATEDIIPANYEDRLNDYRKQLSMIRLRNEDARKRINQNLSVREAIMLAEELRAWHKTIEPTLNEIVDFTSIFVNQNAITKTTNRLDSIIKDEKKIRNTLSVARWASFTQLIKQTQTLIKNAHKFNKKAVELLAQLNETEEGITIENLIIQSENNIKAAYTNFLGMSKLIKK